MVKYLYFHSEQCPHSVKILNALKQHTVWDQVRVLNISILPKIPPYIKRVPTLAVSKQEMYIGINILDWANKKTKQLSNVSTTYPLTLNTSSIEYTYLNTTKPDVQTITMNPFSNVDMKTENIRTMSGKKNSNKCTQKEYDNYLKERNKLTATIASSIR